jgi:hypothetical protein
MRRASVVISRSLVAYEAFLEGKFVLARLRWTVSSLGQSAVASIPKSVISAAYRRPLASKGGLLDVDRSFSLRLLYLVRPIERGQLCHWRDRRMIAEVMIQTPQNAIAISKNSIIAPLTPQGSCYFNTTVLLVPSVRCPTRQKKAKASFLRLHGAGSREAILRCAGLWNRSPYCALALSCNLREQRHEAVLFCLCRLRGRAQFLDALHCGSREKSGPGPSCSVALDADPDLKLVSTQSPYMRTER